MTEAEDRQLKWDLRFLRMAKNVSEFSKDPSTKSGAIITDGIEFVSMGYNGLTEGVEDTWERLNNRKLKYELIIHSEVNATIFANRPLKGCTLYTWPFCPCSRCAAQMLQHKIRRFVYPKLPRHLEKRWLKNIRLTFEMFVEKKVQYVEIDLTKIQLP